MNTNFLNNKYEKIINLKFIKTLKDLIFYIECENIKLENIFFEGSILDFDTTKEIAVVTRQNDNLNIITNFYGILAKQNIIPDIYRDLIFDNKILFRIMSVFNDLSIKLILQSVYLKYNYKHIKLITSSILRNDIQLSHNALISGALILLYPLITYDRLNYLLIQYLSDIDYFNFLIESKEIVYFKNYNGKKLGSYILGNFVLGKISCTKRAIVISIKAPSSSYNALIERLKIIKTRLNYFSYSYLISFSLEFLDTQHLSLRLNSSRINFNSVLFKGLNMNIKI